MKKVITILLSLALIISLFPATIFADESNIDMPEETQTTINEYDAFESLSKESDSKLALMGYSKEKIEEIRNFKEEYKNQIETLKTYDYDVLKKFKYTDEQIEIIRNFTGSTEEIKKVSATLNLNVIPQNFKFDGNYTTGTLSYFWGWNGIPINEGTDLICATWNGWAITSRSCKAYYYSVVDGSLDPKNIYSATEISPDNSAGGINGAGYKFNMLSGLSLKCYYGEGYYKLKSDVHARKDLYYYMAYGKQTINLGLGFSISGSGPSVGLTFKTGITKLDPKNGVVVPK